jgi:hypothetical protein
VPADFPGKLAAAGSVAQPAEGYAGAAALKAYRYPKGVSGFECRQIFQENSPELARAWLLAAWSKRSGAWSLQ